MKTYKLSVIALLVTFASFTAVPSELGDSIVDLGQIVQSPPTLFNVSRDKPTISFSESINKSVAVGKIDYTEDVSQTGAKTFNIPILTRQKIPFVPEISIAYNSQASMGNGGYGWNIAGISEITVTNRNRHYHSWPSAPDLSQPENCAFSLDGVQLVENIREPADFHLETAEGFILAKKEYEGNSISRFFVKYPNGNTAVFGIPGGQTKATYPITESTSPTGQKIFYEYVLSEGVYNISRILYGGTNKNDCIGIISFEYESRDNYSFSYKADTKVGYSKLLKRIESSIISDGNSSILRFFNLTHTNDACPLLTEINSGNGSLMFNPLHFTYGYSTGGQNSILQASEKVILSDASTEFFTRNMITSRGKFLKGKYNDGLIIYPEFNTYKMNTSDFRYGSDYNADQQILIASGLTVAGGKSFFITAGEGFQEATAVDIDGDGADEIVTINSTLNSEERFNRLTIKAYKFTDDGQALNKVLETYYELDAVTFPGDSWNMAEIRSPMYHFFNWGDFDGDGAAELLDITGNRDVYDNNEVDNIFYLFDFSTRQGKVLPTPFSYNGGTKPIICTDATGDGKTDICILEDACYSFDGIRFVKEFAMQHVSADYPHNLMCSDINADGKVDFIVPVNESYDTYERYDELPLWAPVTCPFCGIKNPISDLYTQCCKSCDRDIYAYFVKTQDNVKCRVCDAFMEYHAIQDEDPGINSGFFCPNDGNASRLIGINPYFYDAGKSWTVFYATGKGFVESPMPIIQQLNGDKFFMADANNDGFGDLVMMRDSKMHLLLNENGKIKTEGNPEPVNASFNTTGGFGKIATQFLTANPNHLSPSHLVLVDGYTVRAYVYSDDASQKGLITSFTDSFGATTETEYSDMTNPETYVYGDFRNSTDEIGLIAPIQLVKRTTSFQEEQPRQKVGYKYYGAMLNKKGLGFRGFSKTETKDEIDETVSTVKYLDLGTISEVDNRSRHAVLTYSPTPVLAGSKTENRAVTKSIVTDKSTGVVTTDSYTYDGFGNPTVQGRTCSGSSDGMTATIQYANRTESGCYLVGLPTDKSIRKTRGAESWTEREKITYNEVGLPLVKETFTGISGTNKTGETRYSYDTRGNKLTEMSSPYSSGVFTGNTYTYDVEEYRLLSATDALGRTTSYSQYDPFGNPLKTIDCRGNTTTYEYDELGRLLKSTTPDRLDETTVRAWTTEEPGCYSVKIQKTGQPDKVSFFDEFGQELRNGNLRFNGKWQHIDTEYDHLGRKIRVSDPFFGESPSRWNTYEYDNFGRVLSLTEASGKVMEKSYSGLAVTVFENGISKRIEHDWTGKVLKITDESGTIVNSYRADGQLSETVAPGGPVTTFDYDEFGRRIALHDPGAGTRTTAYEYINGGLVQTDTDNDGRSVKTIYDRFDRIIRRERPEFNTVYSYYPDGQIKKEESTNGVSREYTYDSYGRISMDTRRTPGGHHLTKEYAFEKGNLWALNVFNNRAGYKLEYFYQNGTKVKVLLDDAKEIWKLNAENHFGLPTSVTTGAVTRTYEYDANGYPLRRSAGSFLKQKTVFEPNAGLLLSRTDELRGLAETFEYDGLNRLSDENGSSIVYDAKGNIVEKDGVGVYEYGTGQNAYRMTGLTTCDNSTLTIPSQSFTYNSLNRPATILVSPSEETSPSSANPINPDIDEILPAGHYKATLTYNDAGERVRMKVVSAKETTIYIGDSYERDSLSGNERLYVDGDAYSAYAVLVKTKEKSWTLHYIFRDYLGSIVCVTDEDGAVEAEYSYDAWGRLRNPDTHEVYSTDEEPQLMLKRGFGGHEYLPWCRLYNMNARLYDPALGRFLSPDPFVQSPDFSQNFNRYAYVLNNPFKYTDPSGEFILTAIIGFIKGLRHDENPFYAAWKGIKNEFKLIGGLFITNKNYNFWNKAWQLISRFTWQRRQTLLGLTYSKIRNTIAMVDQVYYYRGAVYAINEDPGGTIWRGITLGNYIGIKEPGEIPINKKTGKFDPTMNQYYMHEYGHYIQSQQSGPAYLLMFGVESLWAAWKDKLIYTEKDANYEAREYFMKHEGLEEWNNYLHFPKDYLF